MKKCPTSCSGGNENRQHLLSDGQLAQLSNSAKKEVAESKGSVYRCNYCGCIYLNELSGTRILGYLDNGILGEGWHSEEHPN